MISDMWKKYVLFDHKFTFILTYFSFMSQISASWDILLLDDQKPGK